MTPADTLRLRLEFPATVAAGDPVPFTFRVENVADRPLDLYLTGREVTFDVIVERAGERPVWRRLEGEIIPAVLRLETLPPGGALVLRHTWDQRSNSGARVPAGEYRVRAELLTEQGPLASPATTLVIRP